MFLADLVRAIDVPVTLDFMALSSYAKGTTSSGEVRLLKDLDSALEGRDVLIVEDIVDTGLTLQLPAGDPERPRARRACAPRASSASPRAAQSTCEWSISDSRSRTISSSATASTTPRRYRNLPHIAVLDGQ